VQWRTQAIASDLSSKRCQLHRYEQERSCKSDCLRQHHRVRDGKSDECGLQYDNRSNHKVGFVFRSREPGGLAFYPELDVI